MTALPTSCAATILHLTCFLIQDTHLRCIAICHMRDRIRHICSKRICLCKIFSVINLPIISSWFSCISVFHQLLTGSSACFPCYQSLSGAGSCTGIRCNPGIASLIYNILTFHICIGHNHLSGRYQVPVRYRMHRNKYAASYRLLKSASHVPYPGYQHRHRHFSWRIRFRPVCLLPEQHHNSS